MSEPTPERRKTPSLFRNYISLVGGAIVIASLVSVTLLFLIEITSSAENPYLGILTYIIFPSVVFLALTAETQFRAVAPVRRWWYPMAPVVFIAGSGVLGLMLLMHNPAAALLGAGIVLSGLPVRWMLSIIPRSPKARDRGHPGLTSEAD